MKNPFNIEDMLRVEEEEDEEIIEAMATTSMNEENPPLPLQPPPSIPPPSPSPQTRAKEVRTKDLSGPQTRDEEARTGETPKVRPDLPSPSSEVIFVAEVPQLTSSSSGQAKDVLMERVQRLLGALTTISTQPTPLAQQATPKTSTELADLLEAGR